MFNVFVILVNVKVYFTNMTNGRVTHFRSSSFSVFRASNRKAVKPNKKKELHGFIESLIQCTCKFFF